MESEPTFLLAPSLSSVATYKNRSDPWDWIDVAKSKQSKRVAIYARISQDDGDDLKEAGRTQEEREAAAIERQVRDCRKLAADYGWDVTYEFRDVASGYDSNAKRPEFRDLTAYVESGAIDVVLAYAIDRISRRVRVTAAFADILEEHEVELITVREREMSGVMLHILAALAQNESKVMSLRIRKKFEDDFQAKGVPRRGGQRPFGYEQVSLTEGQRWEDASPWYEQKPEEAAVVNEMAKRVIKILDPDIKSETSTDLVKDFYKKGYTTQYGKPWRWQSIRHKLESPTIAGYMRHDNFLKPAPWKAIITEKQWARLCELFGLEVSEVDPGSDSGVLTIERIRKRKERDHSIKGVLTGLIRTELGNPMVHTSSSGYDLYGTNGPPDHTSIRRDVIEAYVFEQLEERMKRASDDHIARAIEATNPPEEVLANVKELRNQERSRAEIEADLAEVEEELRRLSKGMDSTSQTLKALMSDAVEREKRYRVELALSSHRFLQPVETGPGDPLTEFNFGRPVTVTSLDPWLEKASLEDKRMLLSQWIESIVIGSDKDAIRALREEYSIETDHQWRKLKDDTESPSLKTRLKTPHRTKIIWRKGAWPYSMDARELVQIGLGELGHEDYGVELSKPYAATEEEELPKSA